MRIKPFAAVRPDPEQVQSVASVPYDVVNRAEAAELAEGNSASFLHVVRPDIDLSAETDPYDDAIYAKAKENFARFLEAGTLIQEAEPALYLYRQVMGEWSQVGLVCCCHIDEYENNTIKKHEKTRQAKEDDRTRHVKTLNANTGPVFLTYRDEEALDLLVGLETERDPLYDFTADDGVQHTVWRIVDTEAFVRAMGEVPVAYVADGHHRSASAWRAGKERAEANGNHTGEEEYNWFLTVMFPATQLHILPYNRVIRDLAGKSNEQIRHGLSDVGRFSATGAPDPARPGSLCVYLNKAWYDLEIDETTIDRDDPIRSLDVSLVQTRVLEPIFGIADPRTDTRIDFVGGIRGVGELERRVDGGGWACAFLMYPTTIEQLMGVADADEIMPPKSTWFEPKLRSGLLVHLLD